MAQDDPHSVGYNLINSIGSTNRIPILYPNDFEMWILHMEDYVLGSDSHGSTIWHAMTIGPYQHAATRSTIKTQAEYEALLVDHTNVTQDEKDKLLSNIKAMRILRFALPPDTLRLVSSYETAKEMWDRLKELYSGDTDLEHSVQTNLLSEFGAFTQKSDEKLEQTFNRYNHLLSRMLKYKLERSSIEQKVTFLNGLRSEWKMIVSTIKAHEQFKNYTLAKMVGILKSHEEEIKKEDTISSLGNLALITKGKNVANDGSDSDWSDEELSREDKALMVSNPKRFFKKNFSKFRNRGKTGGFSSEKPKEEHPKNTKGEEEKKPKADSGYTCYYCGGSNHIAEHCMLRIQHEKNKEENEKEKDEAYYVGKLEEIRKKNTPSGSSAFVVMEDNEDETKQVWSTDSEDEEVRRPLHGRCFMVSSVPTASREEKSEEGNSSDRCFATKTVSERVKEVENVVDKVHSILKSLNICPSTYNSELEDLRFTVGDISDSLKRTRLSNTNLSDDLSRVKSKSEDRRIKIESLELELVHARDDIIILKKDNLVLLKQRNIFCLIAKRLYSNITQLHLDCDIGRKLHKMILPFLELKEDEIDAECYNCESIVSSEETSDAYKIGLDKIESFITSKDHKYMLKNVLSDKDNEEIKITTNQKFQTLCEKLKSEQPPIAEDCSDSDDDDMSEISIESEVDCSTFSHEKEVPRQNLISENSEEYISVLNDKGPQVLKAKATVYPRIQTVPNQVYVQKGLNHKDTHELKSIVDQDNADGCGSFWTDPIDSIDETSGLSAKTSWRVKGKYVSEPLNNIHAKYDGSKPRTPSNSKNIPDKTLPKKNTNKCPEVSIPSTSSTSKERKGNNIQRKDQLRNNHVLTKTH
jgi:hypothetical protein